MAQEEKIIPAFIEKDRLEAERYADNLISWTNADEEEQLLIGRDSCCRIRDHIENLRRDLRTALATQADEMKRLRELLGESLCTIEEERDRILDSECLADEKGQPDRETLSDMAQVPVAFMDALIGRIRAALSPQEPQDGKEASDSGFICPNCKRPFTKDEMEGWVPCAD